MSSEAKVRFVPSGRGKARCAPDPNFPNGITLDGSDHAKPHCTFTLPYPAPECGMWYVECQKCGMNMLVTAAGRPDDPVSVTVNCLAGKV